MSKKAKTQAREKRLKDKRGKKAANAAQYAAWSAQGSNRKKKIAKAQDGLTIVGHPCGNIGCLKCSEVAILGKLKLRMRTHGPKAKIEVTDRFGEKHIIQWSK